MRGKQGLGRGGVVDNIEVIKCCSCWFAIKPMSSIVEGMLCRRGLNENNLR